MSDLGLTDWVVAIDDVTDEKLGQLVTDLEQQRDSPDRGAEPDVGAQPDVSVRRGRDIAPEHDGAWTTGFVMALPNTRTVRRSNALLGWPYGSHFRYTEAMSVGSSRLAPVAAAIATGGSAVAFGLGSRFFRFLPQRLVERVVPKPGTGPSEDKRERGHYTVETYTTTTSGARYRATMAQRGDPGYKATSVLLGRAAWRWLSTATSSPTFTAC